MKEISTKIPIATLLITYLFISGLLYLIGYWGTFDIDVFNLISIYDIPKSFVFPLLISQGFFVINFMTGSILSLDDKMENRKFIINIKEEWSWKKQLFLEMISSIEILVLLICTISFVVISFFTPPFLNEGYWIIVSFTIAYYLMYRYSNLEIIKKYIQNPLLRTYTAYLLIFFPISCFSIGKILSLKIYHNKVLTEIKVIDKDLCISNKSKVKFLGFISDNFIYCSMDNKTIYIINKPSVIGIQLLKK